jgi:hypothetical protein
MFSFLSMHRRARDPPRRELTLDEFDLARLPGLVEKRRQGAVETQDVEPALRRIGLYPVPALHALRLLGTGIDGGRAVRGRDRRRRRIALGTGAWILLRCH